MDVERLAQVLKAGIPGFEALEGCERLSAGASRETYRLKVRHHGADKLMALRRSPTGEASAMQQGPGLSAEAALFRAAREAGVPGPEVFYVLEPKDGLGAGFAMEWIAGETLGARISRSPEFVEVRKTLARQCGEVLGRLHGVDVKASGLDKALDTMTAEQCVRRTYETYLSLDTPQPMIDYACRWLLENLPRGGRPLGLVHSDFRNGNLIVDPGQGVVAVLDWELAHVGDPYRDLGWVCTRSWRFGVPDKPVGGFGEYDDLFAGYEAVTGRPVDREAVRFWEVFGSFWWAVGCLSMGNSWRTGMEKSVERPAIGRRSAECQIDLVNLLIPGPAHRPVAVSQGKPDDLPTLPELLTGVRDFLRGDAGKALQGRNNFLARVAGNAVDIALRELELGPAAKAHEADMLKSLPGGSRRGLCEAIRSGGVPLADAALQQYLRDTVLAQALIDQPDYPGTIEALGRSER